MMDVCKEVIHSEFSLYVSVITYIAKYLLGFTLKPESLR